jgi:adenylate cyclase
MPTRSSFDFKAWHDQILVERQRIERELARINKLTEILASFINQESQPLNDGFAPPEEMRSDFDQLATLNKKIQLLYFLLDVVREFSTETNTDRLHTLISERAAALINADRAALFLIDPVTNELCARIPEQQRVREMRFQRNIGVIGFVANSGRTLNIPDIQQNPQFNPEIDEKPVYSARNLLVTPLRDNTGNILGVLEVLNKSEGKFTPDDEYLLQAFSAQVALTLRNPPTTVGGPPIVSNPVLLIMKALSSGLGTDNLLQSLMRKTTQVMNADRSTLFLIDFDRNELWSKVAEGNGISEIRVPIDSGVAGYVVASSQTLNIPNAYEDRRFNQSIDARTGYLTQSILCAPLKDETGRVIGALQVLNKKHGRFTLDDESLLTAFANQVGRVVKSSQLVLNLLSILENERAAARQS